MKTKLSPAVVGAFVLGAFAIGIIALLALGSLSLFSKPERFMVYFDEAISGLDEGSPVKLRGVRVGHVVGISIRYDQATGKSLAAVLCELNQGRDQGRARGRPGRLRPRRRSRTWSTRACGPSSS